MGTIYSYFYRDTMRYNLTNNETKFNVSHGYDHARSDRNVRYFELDCWHIPYLWLRSHRNGCAAVTSIDDYTPHIIVFRDTEPRANISHTVFAYRMTSYLSCYTFFPEYPGTGYSVKVEYANKYLGTNTSTGQIPPNVSANNMTNNTTNNIANNVNPTTDLAKSLQCVLLSNRGRMDDAPSERAFTNLVQNIISEITTVGVSVDRVILCGIGFGCLPIISACKYRKDICGIVLINPPKCAPVFTHNGDPTCTMSDMFNSRDDIKELAVRVLIIYDDSNPKSAQYIADNLSFTAYYDVVYVPDINTELSAVCAHINTFVKRVKM